MIVLNFIITCNLQMHLLAEKPQLSTPAPTPSSQNHRTTSTSISISTPATLSARSYSSSHFPHSAFPYFYSSNVNASMHSTVTSSSVLTRSSSQVSSCCFSSLAVSSSLKIGILTLKMMTSKMNLIFFSCIYLLFYVS